MSVLTAPLAATLVAICAPHVLYAGIWFAPQKFMKASRKMFSKSVDPVDSFASMAYAGKVIQILAFGMWYFLTGPFQAPSLPLLAVGVAMLALGQTLNVAAIQAIGKVGIYYGFKLGHSVPWFTGFPFSVVPHPQYVGSVLSVWGVWLMMGTPAHWAAGMFWIGLVWSLCYVVSGLIEQYM